MSAQINLYNPALRRKREWISATNLVLGLLVVLCGVGLAYVYFEVEVGRLSAEGRAVETTLSAKQEEFTRLNEELARIARSPQIEATLRERERQLRARQDIVDALGAGELGVRQGFSGVMKALARQTVSGLWLTGIEMSAGGGQVALSGRTLSAELLPQYVQKLNAEPALTGLGFAALDLRLPELAPEASADTGGAAQNGVRRRAPYLEFSLQALTRSGEVAAPMPAAGVRP